MGYYSKNREIKIDDRKEIFFRNYAIPLLSKLSTQISPECESDKHRESCSEPSTCACECHGPETLNNIDRDMNKERVRREQFPSDPAPSNIT